MPDDQASEKVVDRLGRFERDLAALTTEVTNLTKNVQTLVETSSREARTQWNVLIPTFSLTVTIVTVIGWLTINPINESLDRINTRLEKDNEFVIGHTQDGHPQLIRQLVLENRDRITKQTRGLERVESALGGIGMNNTSLMERIRAIEREVFSP